MAFLEILLGGVCGLVSLVLGGLGLMVLYRNSGRKLVFTCTSCGAVEKHFERNVDRVHAALAKCPHCRAGRQTISYE